MASNSVQSTSQKYLEIYDITNNILVLKDGATAMVCQVNAMNFGLLAEPEQDAIIYSYAGLLNSLNYPLQIVIRSQTKDVTTYLNLLEEEEEKATDQVKKSWIRRYRTFVGELIKERNVLDKKFYMVIPASSLEMGLLPPSTVIPGVNQPDLSTIERSVILEKAQEILEPKRDHLLGQLGRIGLVGRQLKTQEIIQLFYLSYNPEAAEGQQITDSSSYTTPFVQASFQGGFMTDQTPNTNPTPTTGAPATASTPDSGSTPTPSAPPAMPAAAPATPASTEPTPTPEEILGSKPATGIPETPAATPASTPTPSAMPSSTGAVPPVTPPSMNNTSPAAPGATPTPMATPSAPAAGMPATPELQAQDEINSTLKNLSPTDVKPDAPAAGTPTPATPASGGDSAAKTDATPAGMPPLPEI